MKLTRVRLVTGPDANSELSDRALVANYAMSLTNCFGPSHGAFPLAAAPEWHKGLSVYEIPVTSLVARRYCPSTGGPTATGVVWDSVAKSLPSWPTSSTPQQ